MTLADDVVASILDCLPIPDRGVGIYPVDRTSWEATGTGFSSFTLWVDLGSGARQVFAEQRVLDYARTFEDTGTVAGRQAIVAFISGVPYVIGFQGSITVAVP